jgi:protein-tyrosine phosphatase
MTLVTNPRALGSDQAPPRGCFWAEPRKLLAGRYPGSTVEEVEAAGVTLFVDLTEEGELEPYAQRLSGPRHVRFPIVDMWVTSAEQLVHTLDVIDQEIASGGIVYVHCWGGCGRTGTVVAAWWVRHGADPSEALARYQQLCRAYSTRRCPETPEQVALVRSWQPGR